VTFVESGLPPGTQWAVILNGTQHSSATKTIKFGNVSAATYLWSIPNATATYSYEGNGPVYLASPSSGGLNICSYFFNTEQQIAFYPVSTTISSLSVSISSSPTTVYIGESVLFYADASGGEPNYNYQWYANGSQIVGETSAGYVFNPNGTGQTNIYASVQDASNSTITSNTIAVTVNSRSLSQSPTIPEYPSWVVLPLFFSGFSVIVIVRDRKPSCSKR
jgi:hypothetical protein